MEDFDEFLAHTVTVSPYLGTGSYGPRFGPEVVLRPEDGTGVLVDETVRMVRASDGTEAVSSTTIVARTSQADLLRVGSRVKLPSGDTTTVLSSSVATMPGLEGMPEHLEAALE